MKFGPVPVAEAEGAILAHGLPRPEGFAKGITLTADHVAALQAEGIATVTVAVPEPDDVPEDAAATALAQALVPNPADQGLRLTTAATGRVNLIAERPGITALDTARLTDLNRVDPMITLATLPDLHRVAPGTMVGTIKVISYAVARTALDAACARAAGGGAGQPPGVMIRAAQYTTATLIETQHPGEVVRTKGRRVLADRLERLGAGLTEVLDVPHDVGAIAAALARAKGQVVFLLTASATSDARDTAPAALHQAGGHLVRYGMPVDPGNLLFLGIFGDRPVVGLPGCARSPALNGADWVLERVVCGSAVDAIDIAGMGVGGLLKEIPTRPRPRAGGH